MFPPRNFVRRRLHAYYSTSCPRPRTVRTRYLMYLVRKYQLHCCFHPFRVLLHNTKNGHTVDLTASSTALLLVQKHRSTSCVNCPRKGCNLLPPPPTVRTRRCTVVRFWYEVDPQIGSAKGGDSSDGTFRRYHSCAQTMSSTERQTRGCIYT